MKRTDLVAGQVYAWKPGKYDGARPALVLDPAVGYFMAGSDSTYHAERWEVRRRSSAGGGRFLVAIGFEITGPNLDPHGSSPFTLGSTRTDLGARRWVAYAALPQQLRSTWSEHAAEQDERRAAEARAFEISRRAEEARKAQQAIEAEAREAQRQVDLARRSRIRASNDELLEKRILPTLEDVVGRDLRPNGDAHDSITLTLDDLQRLVSRLEVEA